MAKPRSAASGRANSSDFLKVVAVLDQFDALGEHGAVFLLAVAVGNDDDGLQAEQAGGHAHALAMIAAGGGDHAFETGLGLRQPDAINQRAAQLEGADRASGSRV